MEILLYLHTYFSIKTMERFWSDINISAQTSERISIGVDSEEWSFMKRAHLNFGLFMSVRYGEEKSHREWDLQVLFVWISMHLEVWFIMRPSRICSTEGVLLRSGGVFGWVCLGGGLPCALFVPLLLTVLLSLHFYLYLISSLTLPWICATSISLFSATSFPIASSLLDQIAFPLVLFFLPGSGSHPLTHKISIKLT